MTKESPFLDHQSISTTPATSFDLAIPNQDRLDRYCIAPIDRLAASFAPSTATRYSFEPDLSDKLPESNLAAVLTRPEPVLVEDFAGRPDPVTEQLSSRRPDPVLIEFDSTALASNLSRSTSALGKGRLSAVNVPPTTSVTFTQVVFSGNEGTSGTLQIRLTQAPSSPVTLTLAPGNFLVVDADNNLQNGTQSTLTFTASNWNQPQTIWFMAEVDGVSSDRTTGNSIAYTLSGGATVSGSYDLGTVKNTYSPDLSRFNIDLDFRNDTTGFWTQARRTIAQKAADDWAVRIANEWTGLQLNTTLSKIGGDGNYSGQTFATKRYVDDLLVFVNTINTGGVAGGFGGVEYDLGGWFSSPELKPRVGQIAIDPAVGDYYLYNAVLHELGHTLGLVGLNWEGFAQQNLSSPQAAVFTGIYATAANGGNAIPLQSQDGPNSVTGEFDYWHPANSVSSIMSYRWIYSLTAPTAIDFALLADSGYRVYGVNA